MRISYLVFVIFLALSCKLRNFSEVKHEFGQTRRGTENFDFEACELTYESKTLYPITQAHLQKIAMDIMRSNPGTFGTGSKLDPKFFCINVLRNDSFNAFARIYNRSITFHTSVFDYLGSDASIAAIMAHELAHITMLHKYESHPKFIPTLEARRAIDESTKVLKLLNANFNRASALRNSALIELEKIADDSKSFELQMEFISLFDEKFYAISTGTSNIDLRSFAENRNRYLSKIHVGIRPLIAQKIDEIVTLLMDSAGLAEKYDRFQANLKSQLVKNTSIEIAEGMNWIEQEADEVGLEFYRRAGFQDSYFFEMLYQLAIISGVSPQSIANCMQMSFKAILVGNGSIEPPRGGESHPETCWRIFDHQRELVLHKNDYKSFPNNKVMLSIGGLANAVNEIRSIEIRLENNSDLQVAPFETSESNFPIPPMSQ